MKRPRSGRRTALRAVEKGTAARKRSAAKRSTRGEAGSGRLAATGAVTGGSRKHVREPEAVALPAARRRARVEATVAPYLDAAFYAASSDRTWIAEIAGSEATTRMELARRGIPAYAVAALADALDMSREALTRELRLPRSTVARGLRERGSLGQAESERVLGVVRLIGQVQRIVEESGEPTGFDAARWTARWLLSPVAALGGRPPMEYMDTAEGRALVSQLLAQVQSGTYA